MRVAVMLVIGMSLVVVGAAASGSGAKPGHELRTKAIEVIKGSPKEYLAALVEVKRVSSLDDPMGSDSVVVRGILGQRTTRAAGTHVGETELLLVAFLSDRSEIRAGSKVLFVGVPLWIHDAFSGYSPLAYKLNPTAGDISEVERAVREMAQPGV